jgi:hypothetical protein
MGKYDTYSVDYEHTHGGGHKHTDVYARSEAGGIDGYGSTHRDINVSSGNKNKHMMSIPCHHIRVGDLVILQNRPCQIIKITTSQQTGQHRYLGVDLFTQNLHEEPCVVSHPSPSVILHNMLGPLFKQYRLIDLRRDGKCLAMDEEGTIKSKLKIVKQGNLLNRLHKHVYAKGGSYSSSDDGPPTAGPARLLVVTDSQTGDEMIVDFKVAHNGHKL